MLNIVHGTRDVVNNILEHPDIKAVSFVGSNAAGRYISERASANGKRVQVSHASLSWSLLQHAYQPWTQLWAHSGTILMAHLIKRLVAVLMACPI